MRHVLAALVVLAVLAGGIGVYVASSAPAHVCGLRC
jgi:hypothetical protein